VTRVSWTLRLAEVACRAAARSVSPCHRPVQFALVNIRGALSTHRASPHDPRAGSYKPPGTGFNKVSNVLSFSIRLTEIERISCAVRNLNSTLSREEETGWEIFMAERFDGRARYQSPMTGCFTKTAVLLLWKRFCDRLLLRPSRKSAASIGGWRGIGDGSSRIFFGGEAWRKVDGGAPMH